MRKPGLGAYENRIIRGQILKVLKVAYPYPARLTLLETMLNDRDLRVTETSIRGHLTYLEGKGYVRVQDVQDPELGEYTNAVLEPKGIDLLEGNIPPDPGVEL